MRSAAAARVAFALLLMAGILAIAVPAASVGYGFRMTTGKPTALGCCVVILPVQIANRGFLGIDGITLHVEVTDGGGSVYSPTVGPVDLQAGASMSFDVAYVNRSSPVGVAGNLSAVITGTAVVGGVVPVSLTVAAGGAPETPIAAAGSPGVIPEAVAIVAIAVTAVAAYGGGGFGGKEKEHAWWSASGAGSGAVAAALYLLILVSAARLAGQEISRVASAAAGGGHALMVTSSMADFVLGWPCLVLVSALAATELAMRAPRGRPRLKGWLKAAEGALLCVFFYFLLNGGEVAVGAAFGGVSAAFVVGVLLPLVLFALAGGARAVQGILESRSAGSPRQEAAADLAVAESPHRNSNSL